MDTTRSSYYHCGQAEDTLLQWDLTELTSEAEGTSLRWHLATLSSCSLSPLAHAAGADRCGCALFFAVLCSLTTHQRIKWDVLLLLAQKNKSRRRYFL